MKVDPSRSRYHEVRDAKDEFNRQELRRARLLLRRLRFLEAQIADNGGLSSGSANGGAAFAEWEVEALEWVLGPEGIGFLETTGEPA